ncbi:hypothetical protein M885DRAFT_509946 [Pelagophyceae sp. CCMP2097]|nr:hypothetical protein M885DRAFT_509946 [Pelagophyceae sp. CCMP2097]
MAGVKGVAAVAALACAAVLAAAWRRRRLELAASEVIARTKREASRKRSKAKVVQLKRSKAKLALVRLAKARFEEQQQGHEVKLVAPTSPSPPELIEQTLRDLERLLVLEREDGATGPLKHVVDLGCGDARWLVAACESYRCTGLGYDIDEDRLAAADVAIASSRLAARVRVVHADLASAPLGDADVVVAYLFRDGCKKLRARLERDLKPGAVVVAVGFAMRGWVPLSDRKLHALAVRIYRPTRLVQPDSPPTWEGVLS